MIQAGASWRGQLVEQFRHIVADVPNVVSARRTFGLAGVARDRSEPRTVSRRAVGTAEANLPTACQTSVRRSPRDRELLSLTLGGEVGIACREMLARY